MKTRLLLAALAAAAVPLCPARATVPSNITTVTCRSTGAPLTCLLPYPFNFSTDLAVTLDGATLSIGTDYTVSCAGCSGGTGSVTMVVTPGDGQSLVVSRVVPYTQLFDPRQGKFSPGAYGAAYDTLEMQIQQLAALGGGGGGGGGSGSFLLPRTGAVTRTMNAKAADLPGALDLGAVADGSTNTAAALNLAISSGKGSMQLPASTNCYNLGTTTLNMASNVQLVGTGYGSPGSGSSCITYSGSGCAILFDSVKNAGMSNIDVQVNSASSTAAGICLKSGSSVNEFNYLKNVSISATGTARVSGQVGLLLLDTGQGVYWNDIDRVFLKSWDTGVLMTSTGTTQGVNSNQVHKLFAYGSNNGLVMRAGTKQVTDNDVSITCSRSDGSFSTNINCLLMGDDNVAGVFANRAYVRNDSGTPSVCGVLGTTAGANYVIGDCESGGGVQDNGVGTFPNTILNQLGLGSTVNLMSLGNLVTTKGAQIIGTSWFGPIGNGTAGAGAIVQFHGSDASASNQPGGGWQITSGNGGSGTASPGDILLSPGVRQGSTNGGNLTLGPTSGQGAAGVRIRSGKVIERSTPFAAVDCAGAGISATVSQLLEAQGFTCATAQTLTTPSAQGVSGIVQALPGFGVISALGGPTAIGDTFRFRMKSTAAANFTLAAGTGVTIAGTSVANNGAIEVVCRVTSVTSGSEAITCL